MHHASPRSSGLEVPTDAIAVASVATAHDAAVIDLGPLGTRQADRAQRMRKRPSQAPPLGGVDDAGPWGDWHSRELTPRGHVGWGVAPSGMPQTAGKRVPPDRRDAVPRARLLRAGDLPPVEVPTGADDALRGTHATQMGVALARELVGLLGALAPQGPITPSDHKTAPRGPLTPAGLPRPAAETPPR